MNKDRQPNNNYLTLFSDIPLKVKCLLDVGRTTGNSKLLTIAAWEHLIDNVGSSNTININYGDMPSEIVVLTYMQNTCGSPFFGTYVGAITRGMRWFTVTLREKNVMIDQQFDKDTYPMGFPQWFLALNSEEYHQQFCQFLCKNMTNFAHISWEPYFSYELGDCELRPKQHAQNMALKSSCSPSQCIKSKTRVNLDVLQSMLPYRPDEKEKNVTTVWVKITSDFYTKTVRYHKSALEFISELGGHLGLWVGASLLTLMEIGELLLKLLTRRCSQGPLRNILNKPSIVPEENIIQDRESSSKASRDMSSLKT